MHYDEESLSDSCRGWLPQCYYDYGMCCNGSLINTRTQVIGLSRARVIRNRICNLDLQNDESLPTQLKELLVDCIQLRAMVWAKTNVTQRWVCWSALQGMGKVHKHSVQHVWPDMDTEELTWTRQWNLLCVRTKFIISYNVQKIDFVIQEWRNDLW